MGKNFGSNWEWNGEDFCRNWEGGTYGRNWEGVYIIKWKWNVKELWKNWVGAYDRRNWKWKGPENLLGRKREMSFWNKLDVTVKSMGWSYCV